jgi:photosystem II stability/assembly factor-like uncharacterized protein
MTPEEQELRRALNARSGDPTPEFRARLARALAEDRPHSNLVPALAAVAAAILVFASVGVLLLARQARAVPHPVPSVSTPTPSPQSVSGVLTKPPSPIVLPDNAQLSAPSSTVVWALVAERYLYRSTDRGSTWHQQPLPPADLPQPEISFVSDAEGWLQTGGSAAAQPYPPCGLDPINLWHTTDAGATWQLLGSNGIRDIQCKEGLSFVDSRRGFIGALSPVLAPVIYRTTDGGRTWTESRPLPPPSTKAGNFDLGPGPVRAFGSTLLVAAGWEHSKYVYRSTDGGATWTYSAAAKDAYNNVDFVTDSRWVQLIAPGQSVETTDAGASWHIYGSDYSQAAPIAALFTFADSQVGYATVRGGILRTVDGGLHWTGLHTPGT